MLSVRCELEGQQPHHRLSAIEDNAATWVDLVPWTVGQPIILMAEASLVYVLLPIVQRTLACIADRFTAGGGSVAFAMDCSQWMLRNTKRNYSLKKTVGKATWAWSIRRPTDIEQLDPRYRFRSQIDNFRSSGRFPAVMSASHRAITRGRLPYAAARYNVCAQRTADPLAQAGDSIRSCQLPSRGARPLRQGLRKHAFCSGLVLIVTL